MSINMFTFFGKIYLFKCKLDEVKPTLEVLSSQLHTQTIEFVKSFDKGMYRWTYWKIDAYHWKQ